MKFTDKQIAEAKRRVGIGVACDRACNISDETLAAAERQAADHLGGAVELIEREGIWYPNNGGIMHITFRLVDQP